MSAGDVDAAIERIRRRDADVASLAEAAADGLTAGEGTRVLHQAGVQEWLWGHVPTTWPVDAWADIVVGAALLFDELGLDRYAAIARSDDTAAVLEAWRESSRAGRRAFLAAQRASGVEPPDTDALAWGSVFGSDEARARDAVERELERALVAGDLVPGARGWRAQASALTRATLTTELELPPGQTLLSLVTTERAETWVRAAEDRRLRHWRESAVRRILGPVDAPAELDVVVAPARWLLARAVSGIELSQSGYIARALVVEAVERFGWGHGGKPPRSEADVTELIELHEAATRLHLVRRRGRTLVATANGQRLAGDPEALWRALASTLGGFAEFDQTMGELVGHRLLAGPVSDDEIIEAVGPVLASMGWQSADGPLTAAEVASAIWARWRWWRTLGLLDRRSARWDRASQRQVGDNSTELTPAGVATVLAYLRDRALGARDDIRA